MVCVHVCRTTTRAGSACAQTTSAPVKCTPGTFASSAYSTACTACPKGTYVDVPGALVCLPCPPGYQCNDACAVPLACRPGELDLPGQNGTGNTGW